jgi:chromosome segregation ATPase
MEKQELLEDFKAILDEKMPGHDFTQETVANVGRVIGDAIKSKNEQYEKELLALEDERKKLAEAEEAVKTDLEDLKSKLEAAESKVSALSQEIESRKSEEAFNARMEEVDATYELSKEDRKVLASEVEAIDLDENSFEEYKSKLSVMWAHKAKEYLAEQDKAFEEKLEAELQKRLQDMDKSEASEASEETQTEESEASEEVEEALENAETEEEEVISNNNTASAVEEVSLKEKFAEAFAKENILIKF